MHLDTCRDVRNEIKTAMFNQTYNCWAALHIATTKQGGRLSHVDILALVGGSHPSLSIYTYTNCWMHHKDPRPALALKVWQVVRPGLSKQLAPVAFETRSPHEIHKARKIERKTWKTWCFMVFPRKSHHCPTQKAQLKHPRNGSPSSLFQMLSTDPFQGLGWAAIQGCTVTRPPRLLSVPHTYIFPICMCIYIYI